MLTPLPGAWIGSTIVTIAFVVFYPILLAVFTHQRYKVEWRYFFFGVAIFAIFQLFTRVPLVAVAGTLLRPVLTTSKLALWIYLFILALTAGLTEEIGRWVGYRWFMGREEKTWAKGVMYGLGHGGLESIVLVGGGAILSLIGLLVVQSIDLGGLNAAQQQSIHNQFAAIATQPVWLPLLGAWERLWTVLIQVALSLVVLQGFTRGRQGRWLMLAIALHFIVDFTTVAMSQIFGKSYTVTLAVEGIIGIFGVVALVSIIRFARMPAQLAKPDPTMAYPAPPPHA